jgi:CRP-like cAMP-binding protein
MQETLKRLSNPHNVRFADLLRICERYFGAPRISGSHHIFKTPWQGDPRLNLQRDGSKAKPYQVRDVVRALQKLQEEPR